MQRFKDWLGNKRNPDDDDSLSEVDKARRDLMSDDLAVQRDAIRTMEMSEHPEAVEVLAEGALEGREEVRVECAFALTRKTNDTDERAVPALCDAFRSATSLTAARAAERLGAIGTTAARDCLLEGLTAPSVTSDRLIAALRALRIMGASEAIPAVLELLHFTTHTVQLEAIETLAVLGGVEYADALLEIVERAEYDERVMVRAIDALAEVKAASAELLLIQIIDACAEPRLVMASVQAIGEVAGADGLKPLYQLRNKIERGMDEPHPGISSEIRLAIRKIKNRTTVDW